MMRRFARGLAARAEPLLFAAILSGLMSCLVSGIAIWRSAARSDEVLGLWVNAWLSAWLLAFPLVTLLSPLVRILVRRLLNPGAPR